MPTAKAVDGWLAATPDTFRFTLKAPKRITHDERLKDVGDLVRGFCDLAAGLGPRLATLLFQLPPNLKCDLDVFDAFLDTLPPKVPAAFEFRNASWLDDAVYARLRARNLALCIADTGDKTTPIVETADYGYFRLRDEGYQAADIARWAGRDRRRTRRAGARSSSTSSTRTRGRARSSAQALAQAARAVRGDDRSAGRGLSTMPSQELDRGALGPVAVEVRRRAR